MSSNASENNKRIAKNTMILYLRQLFVLVVSLYTSRVILLVLGVDDFGLYTLVAGVMSAMGTIISTTAGSAARFLTYALGKKDPDLALRTFETALFIQGCMALLALLLSESVGLWFLNYQLNIPPDRLEAANWVFQFSTIAFVFSIVQMPFASAVFAHEKMGVYASIEIFQVVTKLLIILLIDIAGDHDKLISYAFLMMVVSLCCSAFYIIYSKTHFAECRLVPKKDNSLVKSMLLFSGWELYGAFALVLAGQGPVFVVNTFLGVAYNGIVAVVSQVQTAVSGCASAISQASRPQIVKYYAEGRLSEMISLMNNLCSLITLVLAIFIVPLMAEIDFVLRVWLKTPPPEVASLTFIGLISTLVLSVITTLNAGIGATGKNWAMNVGSGTIFIGYFPLYYILLKLGLPLSWCYIGSIFLGFLVILYTAFLCQRQLEGYKVQTFLFRVYLPLFILVGIALLACFAVQRTMEEGWTRLLAVILTSTLTLGFSGFYIMLSRSQREAILRRLPIGRKA